MGVVSHVFPVVPPLRYNPLDYIASGMNMN